MISFQNLLPVTSYTYPSAAIRPGLPSFPLNEDNPSPCPSSCCLLNSLLMRVVAIAAIITIIMNNDTFIIQITPKVVLHISSIDLSLYVVSIIPVIPTTIIQIHPRIRSFLGSPLEREEGFTKRWI